MAEECGERGYAEASVAAVAKRAGVSSVTFYKQFADKRDCLLEAHRELAGRLLEALDRVGRDEVLPTALGIFAADPPSARLLTVEVLAAGREGGALHDELVAALAERLRAGWVPVAGVLALVGKRVLAGEAEGLPALAEELSGYL